MIPSRTNPLRDVVPLIAGGIYLAMYIRETPADGYQWGIYYHTDQKYGGWKFELEDIGDLGGYGFYRYLSRLFEHLDPMSLPIRLVRHRLWRH